MSKKTILLILAAIIFGAGTFYFIKTKDHVSVRDLQSQNFSRKAGENQIALYKDRERIDPSFARQVIIPTSKVKIDVVIPIVEKDLQIAKRTVESVKNLVNHPIGAIYLIAPESEKIRAFAREHGCKFILEDTLLPSPEIKKYGGWIIQQFLKLNADTIVENEYYYVIDSDTILLRPIVFFDKRNKHLIPTHWDCSLVRKRASAYMLGNTQVHRYDLVTHNMLFSKKILADMKKHIAGRFNKNWDQALLDSFAADKDYLQGFSEYDLYGTYLTEFTDVKFKFISNANITVHRNLADRLDHIIPAYASQYRSISLHHFIKFEE